MKELLELRNRMKKKKPKFVRTDANVMKQFKSWRKPIGIHNKRRLSKKGHQSNVSIGYRSPIEVRGLTKIGLKPVIVNNLNDIKKITKEHTIILSSSLGLKNKIQILEKIKVLNLHISNLKDIDLFIRSAKEKLESKKKEKKKQKEEREKSKVEAEKKKKEKEEKEKTEEKQKELSKEAKVEQKIEAPQAKKEKQAPRMSKATAPKSQ